MVSAEQVAPVDSLVVLPEASALWGLAETEALEELARPDDLVVLVALAGR